MPSKAIPWLKVVVHFLCAWGFIYWVQQYRSGALVQMADPVAYLTHATGDWALWMLMVDLAITPLRRLSPKLGWLIRFRRMLGLWAFAYATAHLLIYIFLFSGYDVPSAIAGLQAHHWGAPFHQFALVWPSMLNDLEKRKFIQVGLLAWVLLLVLAATSPQRVLRAMGGVNWRRVHRLVYVAAAAAVIHYWWLVKVGVRTPWKVTAVLAVLLLARVLWWANERRRKNRATGSDAVPAVAR